MKKWAPAFLLLAFCFSACAVKVETLRLSVYEETSALDEEAEADLEKLANRVRGLWSTLEDQKITAYLSKDKIAHFFETSTDLSEFIAIYASLMRRNSFQRAMVLKYRVNRIKIEANGVIARVDMDIWGRIYFLWYARIHEVQRWERSEGIWYMRPEAY